MEEILASIRRIIADDEAKPAEIRPADAKPYDSKPYDSKPSESKPYESKPDAGGAKAATMSAVKSDTPKIEAVKVDPPKPQVVAAKPMQSAGASPVRSIPGPLAKPVSVVGNSQDEIDVMLAGLDETTTASEIRPSLPDGDVFELTDDMALPDPAPKPFRKVDPQDDLEFSESATRYRQSSFTPSPAPSAPDLAAQLAPNILSRSTVSAVESAFNSLANTVLSNNARTLEDLVKEMLRPMLKTWLDDNLPGVVERMVKAEIERVSRGR